MQPPIVLANPEERARARELDDSWNDYIIKEIESDDGESAVVTVGDALIVSRPGFGGWTTQMPWPIEERPAVGNRIRVWSNGSMNHGVSLWRSNRTLIPVYYKTKQERDVEHGYWVAEHQRKQRSDFAAQQAELDAQFEALPPDLQRRIQRFRDEDPDFRWREEAYEMAACAEGGRLYRAAMDPATGTILKEAGIKLPKNPTLPSWEQPKGEGVTDWVDIPENRLLAIDAINGPANDYDYKKLETLFPWIDQGHSGNTWGHAVMFALALVRGDGASL